jgi:protein-S-isoprenylcysteine O-methyltransferase Ste14
MDDYGYGYWNLVILNVIVFGLFIAFIPFRKKMHRLPTSVYLAFIVALYAEMYGFPLTIYILSWTIGYQNVLTHTSGHILAPILGEQFFFTFIHPLSNVLIFIGVLLVAFGWKGTHDAQGELMTTGLYAHVRNPQYLGFLVLTLGMLIQWTTLPTLLMWPLLVILYYRLAKQEEKEMETKFGDKYRKYKGRVPMFLPFPRLKRDSKSVAPAAPPS